MLEEPQGMAATPLDPLDLLAAKVLLVDDEPANVKLLERTLRSFGYRDLVSTTDPRTVAGLFDAQDFDLVILDLNMPHMDGFEVMRQLQARGSDALPPILILTAQAEQEHRVRALRSGAHDYVTKPYRLRELVARMRAVLRRAAERDDAAPLDANRLEVNGVSLDPGQHLVQVDGEPLSLPLKEFELLHLLLANAGQVLPREVLIDRVWGHDYVGDTKTLDVHIKRLRGKIEADPSTPERITTIRGLGYKYSR